MTIHFDPEPERIAFGKTSVKPTMRERIQAEIRHCRDRYDTDSMTKKQLYGLVNRQVACPLPSFYQYLRDLERAEAENESHRVECAAGPTRLGAVMRRPNLSSELQEADE